MKFDWRCGLNVPGTLKWRLAYDWVQEYDECPGEGEIELDDEDVAVYGCQPAVVCPECGGELSELVAHFEPQEGELTRLRAAFPDAEELDTLQQVGGWT